MAKNTKNHMWLDTSGMEGWIEDLDRLGADIKGITEQALKEIAGKIQDDVAEAMQDKYLPAKGIYSTGRTKRTILQNQQVEWEGGTARIPVGFDQTKPGASVYLISGVWGGGGATGTPRMQPDKKLNRIFRQKRYMGDRKKELAQFFKDELEQLTGEVFD